jgi:hypothetical protein
MSVDIGPSTVCSRLNAVQVHGAMQGHQLQPIDITGCYMQCLLRMQVESKYFELNVIDPFKVSPDNESHPQPFQTSSS